MAELEREFERLKKSPQAIQRKESILNFGKSWPDTSQTDKSGSEMSKKLLHCRSPFVEGGSNGEIRKFSHSIHSARYKQVS